MCKKPLRAATLKEGEREEKKVEADIWDMSTKKTMYKNSNETLILTNITKPFII